MTFYHPPLLSLSEQETRRYAGLGTDGPFPEELVISACNDGLLLANPRATWKRYSYNCACSTIKMMEHVQIQSRDVANHLQTAVEVTILAITIGHELEQEVNNRFMTGDYTAGLLLDAAGTTAVEQAADEACKYLASEALRMGLSCTSRYSPGYGDWDIKNQPWVLSLSGGKEIGITINESCLLTPRKSITAIIGLVPSTDHPMASLCQPESCASCRLTHCFARKEQKL